MRGHKYKNYSLAESGLIIPIVNLKALLKFEDSTIEPHHKIAIIDHEGAKVGLVFDSTSEILRANQQIMSEFVYSSEKSHKIISGAIKLESGNRILQIIDPFALVSIENIPQILEQQSTKPLTTRIKQSIAA